MNLFTTNIKKCSSLFVLFMRLADHSQLLIYMNFGVMKGEGHFAARTYSDTLEQGGRLFAGT